MKKFIYILTLLFVMTLMFTGCTKLDVIDPEGDVEQYDYRGFEGDEMDGDDSAADFGEEDEDDDGITDEDDDEDEDDSDTQRGSATI
ncbi:MAG: hypothetical protein ACI84C_000164 [Flavobacteriales bacterium]|jgi:hypothetical protein